MSDNDRDTPDGLEHRDKPSPEREQTRQGPHQDPTLMEAYSALCGAEYVLGPVANLAHARTLLERRMGLPHADLSVGARLGDMDHRQDLRNERLWQETVRNDQRRAHEERRRHDYISGSMVQEPVASGYGGRDPHARSANERQIGGDHYQRGGNFQHWDFVAQLGLDYFQGCATKYVSRARYKGEIVEQLEKAVHYCQKGEEVDMERAANQPVSIDARGTVLSFAVANNLTAREEQAILFITNRDWNAAAAVLTEMLSDYVSPAGAVRQ